MLPLLFCACLIVFNNLLLSNSNVISNEAYFDSQLGSFVIPELQKQKVTFTLPQAKMMINIIKKEYTGELVGN